MKPLVSSINNLYLVNKQFNGCAKNLFNNAIYKDLLFSKFLYVTTELQQKIIEMNDFKTIYSTLNRYSNLKTKQSKVSQQPNNLYYNKDRDIYEMKIAMAGDGGVGKSAITLRYVQNIFVDYNAIIEDSYRKVTMIEGKKFYVDILDAVAQEEFKALRDNDYKVAHCILSVCDLTNKRTLDGVGKCIDRFYKVKDKDNLPIVIVGNQLDLIEKDNGKREITKEMIDELIEKLCSFSKVKPIYVEVSAKTGCNIEAAFCEAIRLAQSTFID
ncbi:hypothetical protein ABK040_006892 [Willaertia magna]